ncbi:beta strand repeat-containing protein [Sulfitobacter aestuariivivens]|uniref:beta strand repeat-containing protein n=1 Tax=Sulfitobacter aestuariivivens TaxID=2766981 RepID=UPI0036162DB9
MPSLSPVGAPGDAVLIMIGDAQVETSIGDDGTFEAIFEGDNFPADGIYETIVVVTTATGDETLDGPGYHIDTTPPDVAVSSGTDSVGDFFNAAAFEDGVLLTGTGEAGATLSLTISGVTQTTVIDADGKWSALWANGTLDAGEYTSGVTIVAADAFGNTTTITDTVVIDTVSNVTIDTENVETDGIVNADEREDGVTLTGTAQAGSSVLVTFGTGSHQATVDANGNWSADFAMSEIPTGELAATVTAVATDSFGNTSTASGEVDIDTLVRDFGFTGTTGGADGVINIAEAASGFTMTGTTEPGATVSVTMNGFTHQATVAANGTWSADFAASEIPTGEQTVVMSATATDIAGNTETITQNVIVDRDAGVLTIDSPIEGDDIVSAAEASDGVILTGTTNPGATVTVTMGGFTHEVLANPSGQWAANFAASEVAPGDYIANILATTVDSAGNPLNATSSVRVDTRVDNLSIDTGAVGGGDNILNAAERLAGGGVQITGTTEVGSTSVIVDLGGQQVNAAVDAAGNWTAVFSAAQLARGTYEAPITVTATDHVGNVDSVSGTIQVDTEVVPFSMTETGGGADDFANAAEAATGIDLGGQVEAGSTVVVNFDGTDHAASVDAAGNWSLTIPPVAIRPGTYAAAISVTATDAAGNVATINDTLGIDTEAPEGPVIASYTRDGDGIRGISTEMSEDDLGVYQVTDAGAVNAINALQADIPVLGETAFQFNSEVPDGSHLVITATDDAGNSSGTYVVLDDEAAATQVTLDASALGSFNIETLDLSFAEEGNLTIDAATLLALSSNTNELQINGGADDTVTISDAVAAGSEVRDGQTYTIYTLGDEGTLIIDDNVNVVI